VRHATPEKIGILGGTFDPVHYGHLRTAEEIGEALDLETVYLMPAAFPPHKIHDPVTPFEQRLAMVQLAVRESMRLQALDLEGRRAGLSYSSDTLKELTARFGTKAEIFFLLGSDAFVEIRTWKNYSKLFEYAHFVIIPRAGYHPEVLHDFILGLDRAAKKEQRKDIYTMASGHHVIIQQSTLMDISGTIIRNAIHEQKSITFLVPEAVRTYILKEGLYRLHEDH
jgi:nicotinate-nucleotide adenylyltransferase